MKIIVTAPTITGGVSYEPSSMPQEVPDLVAAHLVDIGNATVYEQKVAPPKEKKRAKQSSVSQAAPASPKRTVTKRRKAKPKS